MMNGAPASIARVDINDNNVTSILHGLDDGEEVLFSTPWGNVVGGEDCCHIATVFIIIVSPDFVEGGYVR
jgi:hypothetical protein